MRCKRIYALALLLGALLLVPSGANAARKVPVESLYVQYADTAGFALSAKSDIYYALAGHVLKPTVVFAPTNASRAVSWRSSAPKIASVNKKGVVTCKKAGYASIRCKAGAKTFYVHLFVLNNHSLPTPAAARRGTIDASAQRVYCKNGRLTVDMRVSNNTGRAIRKLSTQAVYLTLAASKTEKHAYALVGRVRVKLKKPIPAYTARVVTISLNKIRLAQSDLTDADAYMLGGATFV